MQRFAVEIKSAVWAKLKNIFNKYAEGKDYISVSRLEAMVKQVLHEETPTQVDYVIKNTNRIDKDNNGTIEFQQFGNFLLKRHCGEMALQKMHRCNKITNGHIRKITIAEFGELLNSAYQFLGVQVDQKVVTQIFYNIDKDKDNLITYAQYFGFTDAYLLDTKPLAEKKKQLQKTQIFEKKIDQPAKEFQSRLRKFLMSQIKRLFETYDKDVNKLLDENEMRLLLLQVFGLDSNQINRVLNLHFKPDVQGRYQSYDIFVINFLNYVSELGWLNINRQLLPQGRTGISQGEFFKLIDEAFKHLNIGRVNKGLFLSYFKLLDKNHDGLIDIADFKIWVSKFLSPQRYFGNEYYIQQDDETLSYGKGMISEPVRIQRVQYSPARSIDSTRKSLKLSQIKFDSRITVKQKTARPNKLTDSQISVISNRSGRQIVSRFNFSSLDLAKRVRSQMMRILTRLDKNHDRQFQQPQIIEALQILMKADKRQVLYVVANVFRYDRNNDHIVTYEELANFFLEIHFGEIAIQRLHKQDSYVRGSQRIMNMSQFVRTLDYALSFIQIETYEGQAQTLFKQIDLNKDGWISYQEYFEFLIHYFGTQSVAAQVQRRDRRKTLSQITTNKGQQVPPQERLSRLIRTQIRVLFIEYDKNKNVKFEREQAFEIAKQVLNQTQQQARSIVNIVFSKNPQFVQYDELINKFLEIHSSETILLRLHKQGTLKNHKDRTIDINDFMTLINSAFLRVSVLPSKTQYAQIFRRIDSSCDRITYRQYQHFVARYLGKCDDRSFNTVFEQPSRLTQFVRKSISNTNSNIGNISTNLYSKLKSVYQKYDRNNQGLEKQAFFSFLKQICNQTKRQNLEYIIWAIYRVDQDQDNKINLIQSAPYLLLLLAQLSLQDFHHSRSLLANKQRLSSQDFFSVLQSAYPFCESLKREYLSSIFQQIDNDNDGYVSDIQYLTWINSMSKSCVNPV